MSQAFVYTLLSVFAISLISLAGVFTLAINQKILRKVLLLFVSFAAGTLLGDAFIHLVPKSFSSDLPTLSISFLILSGILIFFILEKFLKWHHCHDEDCEIHPRHIAFMNLVGDGLHNLIDGAIIAGSYLVSIPLGIATTTAVLMHEIPQEIGDFGILLHSGFTSRKALAYNFFSAVLAFAGALFVLLLSGSIESLSLYLLPITAGGFIYIASSDLIPELHKETRLSKSFIQLFFFILGIAIMVLLSYIE